jgi:hypothetical protein
MNGDVKVVDQNPIPAPVVSDVAQPPVSVGQPNKEAEPMVAPTSEFIKPSEVEPQIGKDLAELGVEAKKDEPKIEDEHKEIIDHAKQFSPVAPSTPSKVVMPMSEEEIKNKLETGQDDDSGKGLAKVIDKVMKVLGLK